MNTLRLDFINAKAPYNVQYNDYPNEYCFKSDSGIEVIVSIKEDYSIVPSGAYALGIVNASHKPSPGDAKFRLTLMAIIEEFFEQNNDVMLYLTETGDERQEMRNRLFVRWFNTYEHRDRFFIRTAEGMMEGQMNFMAILSRLDNPLLSVVVEEFDETISLLFD